MTVGFSRFLMGATFLFFTSFSNSFAQGNSKVNHPPVPWDQDEVMSSIVKIISQFCFVGNCQDISQDENVRIGTGFVVEIPDYGRVIATALHNVAGANRVNYQFTTREGSEPVDTTALVISMNDDIVLLRLSDSDFADARPLRLVQNDAERRELLADDLSFVSYGHGLDSPFVGVQNGNVNLVQPRALKNILNVQGGRASIEPIKKAGYPSLFLEVVQIQDALLPGDSGGPIVHQLEPIVIGMSHGAIPISQGKIEWMVPAERILGIPDTSIQLEELRRFGPQDVFYSLSTFFRDGPPPTTPLKNTPSVRFNIQVPKNAPFAFGYLSRLSHWARVPAVRGEWDQLLISKFNRRTYSVSTESRFFPGHPDAMESCGWEYESATCAQLVAAESKFIQYMNALSIEISCYDQSTFDRLVADPTFERADSLLDLKIGLGSMGDNVELSVDYGTEYLAFGTKGYLEFVPGLGRYSRVGLKSVEQLYGGACRVGFDDNGDLGSEWRPTIRKFEQAVKRNGSICIELSLSDTVITPLFFTEYLAVGTEELDEGDIWGLLPFNSIDAAGDDVYCQ